MLHTGVVDEADSDLSLGHSGYGNNDLLHDLFLPPNYTAGCSPVIPVQTILDHPEEVVDIFQEKAETCDLFHEPHSVLLPRQIYVDEPSLVALVKFHFELCQLPLDQAVVIGYCSGLALVIGYYSGQALVIGYYSGLALVIG